MIYSSKNRKKNPISETITLRTKVNLNKMNIAKAQKILVDFSTEYPV